MSTQVILELSGKPTSTIGRSVDIGVMDHTNLQDWTHVDARTLNIYGHARRVTNTSVGASSSAGAFRLLDANDHIS